MNLAEPLITVLMPVYNGERYLKQAIKSILNQTYINFEFIIIDDGSSDHSANIIKSYADQRIILVQNKKNLGLIRTLDKGIRIASGKYIARMDADDISFSTRLATQVNFMEKHPDMGMSGTAIQIIDDNGKQGSIVTFPNNSSVLKWHLCFYCPFAHPSVMFHTGVAKKAGGYFSKNLIGREQYSAEDYDLWRRISAISNIHNISEPLIYLRKHDKNLTKIYELEHHKNSVIISRSLMNRYLKRNPPSSLVESLVFDHKSGKTREKEVRLLCDLYRGYLNNNVVTNYENEAILADLLGRLKKRISYFNIVEILFVLRRIITGMNSFVILPYTMFRKVYIHMLFKSGIR